jgi:hypothetical protein
MPWQERWELRTSTFGCNCSTTTFLAALITSLSTIVGLLILWLLVKLIKALIILWRKDKYGTLLDFDENGQEQQHVWVRKTATWRGWWRAMWRKKTEEITEEEDLLG